jgi:hypothetical protein
VSGPGRLERAVAWIRANRRELELASLFWFTVTGALAVYTAVSHDGLVVRVLLSSMMVDSLVSYFVLLLMRRHGRE